MDAFLHSAHGHFQVIKTHTLTHILNPYNIVDTHRHARVIIFFVLFSHWFYCSFWVVTTGYLYRLKRGSICAHCYIMHVIWRNKIANIQIKLIHKYSYCRIFNGAIWDYLTKKPRRMLNIVFRHWSTMNGYGNAYDFIFNKLWK